ncbi:MAG: hypothetical protein OEM66_02360 [Acidimicrobiia bacterium]|nr:hypothetical protein [Acidimicrobiia bacterium]
MTAEWERLGAIVLTQVHARQIVHDGFYDHARLRPVDGLWLTGHGVVGFDGEQAILDFHHRDHPERRKWSPNRLLSVGFTGHYREIQGHFGHVAVGAGAENIVVDAERIFTEDDLAGGIRIVAGDSSVVLTGAAIARPCLPFTAFLLGNQNTSGELLAAHRPHLDGGIRGYVLGLGQVESPMWVAAGDEVWRRVG